MWAVHHLLMNYSTTIQPINNLAPRLLSNNLVSRLVAKWALHYIAINEILERNKIHFTVFLWHQSYVRAIDAATVSQKRRLLLAQNDSSTIRSQHTVAHVQNNSSTIRSQHTEAHSQNNSSTIRSNTQRRRFTNFLWQVVIVRIQTFRRSFVKLLSHY